MTSPSEGAASGPALSSQQPEFQEFIVRRDNEGPFTFAGVQLAKSTRQTGVIGMFDVLEAAVYRTRGGKFITSLSKSQNSGVMKLSALLTVDDDQDGSVYRKAAVHDTFEQAVAWFKPGRLTDDIRKQLGLDKPIRIE